MVRKIDIGNFNSLIVNNLLW